MFRDGRWHKFMAIEHETKTIKVELTKKLSNRFLQSVRQRYHTEAKAYFPSLIDRQSLTRKNPLRIELIFEDRVAYYLDPYWNVPPTLLFATHQTSPWEPVTIALGQVCYNLILAAQLTCRNYPQVMRHVNYQFCHIFMPISDSRVEQNILLLPLS
jgi:hypothetical protein